MIRIFLRTRSRNRGLESPATNIADAFVVLAWLAGCVLISINTWKNNFRMKYLHAPKETLYYGVPHELSGHLLYVSWISLFFIYISLWSAKAAFLAFYYSIFSQQGQRIRIALLIASIITFATFLVHMFLIAFWCSPISLNWSPPPGEHLCSAVHSMKSVTISTFTNIGTDLVILSIPISTLMRTKLRKSDRAGLIFVFLMGSVSILAALVRFICLVLVQSTPRASITHTIDVWALVEIVSSILAVCLPSLRTFVRHCRPAGSTKLPSGPNRASNSLNFVLSNDGSSSVVRVDGDEDTEKGVSDGSQTEELWFYSERKEEKTKAGILVQQKLQDDSDSASR